jgi:uncharacterized RDD family membrane protein YckC
MHSYATFWRRLLALIIDGLLVAPFAFAIDEIEFESAWVEWLIGGCGAFAILFYTVFGHAKFGKTIGKWIAGIRVVTVDGERIGWKHAWMRSSVDVAFLVWGLIEIAYWILHPAETVVTENTLPTVATYFRWSDWAVLFWSWSELFVMLCNEQRRALHDFIAGTIVVRDR